MQAIRLSTWAVMGGFEEDMDSTIIIARFLIMQAFFPGPSQPSPLPPLIYRMVSSEVFMKRIALLAAVGTRPA